MGFLDAIKGAVSTIANPVKLAGMVVSAATAVGNRLVQTANSLDEMPPKIKKVLQSPLGSLKIIEIVVFREPVVSAVALGAKALTGGDLKTDIRHVFEVFVLQGDGRKRYLRMEKNEVVAAEELKEETLEALKKTTENITVTLTGPEYMGETLEKFMQNYGDKTNPKVLWVYDPVTANCQIFVYLGLVTNGISPTDVAIENFIVQKSVRGEISKTSQSLMKGITTAAAFGKKFVGLAAGSVAEGEEDNMPLVDLLNRHAELLSAFMRAVHVMEIYQTGYRDAAKQAQKYEDELEANKGVLPVSDISMQELRLRQDMEKHAAMHVSSAMADVQQKLEDLGASQRWGRLKRRWEEKRPRGEDDSDSGAPPTSRHHRRINDETKGDELPWFVANNEGRRKRGRRLSRVGSAVIGELPWWEEREQESQM